MPKQAAMRNRFIWFLEFSANLVALSFFVGNNFEKNTRKIPQQSQATNQRTGGGEEGQPTEEQNPPDVNGPGLMQERREE
ncbi:MAG: hypothetical protein Q8P67_01345 [archaeon]|nr:hypothetical protein [archaeon]